MKLFVLVAYLCMMVVVILLTAKKSISLGDFLLGGRKVGPWMSALSYGASYFSAVIIVGYAGSTGWNVGVSAIWIGVGNALVGSLLAWKLLARPTRLMGERLNVGTIPSFFEKRYQSRALKIISSLIIFVFLLPYSASVYKGLGTMIQLAFGFDYTLIVIVVALLCAVYLFLGGYRATAVTDFVQGIIMLAGITAIVAYVVRGAGGLSEGLRLLGTEGVGGAGFNSLIPPKGQLSFLLSNVILTSVGALGLPQMIHKFFAIRDASSIKRATVISTVFALVVAGGAYFAGSFGRVVLSRIAAPDGGTMAALVESGALAKDMIMPTMLTDTTVVGIPDALLGLFVVLLLSASVSTLTSLVLASSSVISIDLIGTFRPNMPPKRTTLVMRLLCVVFVIFSLVINFLMQDTPIMSLMSLSWGAIAGAFLAPFLYGLLWRGVTKAGAFAGVLSGLAIAVLPPVVTGDMSIAPLCGALAMLASLILVPCVSLLTRAHAFSARHIADVFADAAGAASGSARG